MIRAVHSLLIVVLLLTGLALGAARGQARIAGQVVICSGNAVTVLTVDRDGNPVERPHFCPDMALSLLAALTAGAPPTPVPQMVRPVYVARRGVSLFSRPVPARQARGPPVLQML